MKLPPKLQRDLNSYSATIPDTSKSIRSTLAVLPVPLRYSVIKTLVKDGVYHHVFNIDVDLILIGRLEFEFEVKDYYYFQPSQLQEDLWLDSIYFSQGVAYEDAMNYIEGDYVEQITVIEFDDIPNHIKDDYLRKVNYMNSEGF